MLDKFLLLFPPQTFAQTRRHVCIADDTGLEISNMGSHIVARRYPCTVDLKMTKGTHTEYVDEM
jgi:hypothetical protein